MLKMMDFTLKNDEFIAVALRVAQTMVAICVGFFGVNVVLKMMNLY